MSFLSAFLSPRISLNNSITYSLFHSAIFFLYVCPTRLILFLSHSFSSSIDLQSVILYLLMSNYGPNPPPPLSLSLARSYKQLINEWPFQSLSLTHIHSTKLCQSWQWLCQLWARPENMNFTLSPLIDHILAIRTYYIAQNHSRACVCLCVRM